MNKLTNQFTMAFVMCLPLSSTAAFACGGDYSNANAEAKACTFAGFVPTEY